MKALALAGLFSLAAVMVLSIVEGAEKLRLALHGLLASLAVAVYGMFLFFRPDFVFTAGWVGLVAAALVGQLFGSKLLPNPHGLLAFLLTASVVDLMSVASGPTKALIEAAESGATSLVHYLALLLPWHGSLVPALGVGDLFGLAVLLSSLRCQGFSRGLSFVFGLSGILAALVVALIIGGVAGYPFLTAAAVAALVYKRWQSEKFA